MSLGPASIGTSGCRCREPWPRIYGKYFLSIWLRHDVFMFSPSSCGNVFRLSSLVSQVTCLVRPLRPFLGPLLAFVHAYVFGLYNLRGKHVCYDWQSCHCEWHKLPMRLDPDSWQGIMPLRGLYASVPVGSSGQALAYCRALWALCCWAFLCLRHLMGAAWGLWSLAFGWCLGAPFWPLRFVGCRPFSFPATFGWWFPLAFFER